MATTTGATRRTAHPRHPNPPSSPKCFAAAAGQNVMQLSARAGVEPGEAGGTADGAIVDSVARGAAPTARPANPAGSYESKHMTCDGGRDHPARPYHHDPRDPGAGRRPHRRHKLTGNPAEPMTGVYPPSALGTTRHDYEDPPSRPRRPWARSPGLP